MSLLPAAIDKMPWRIPGQNDYAEVPSCASLDEKLDATAIGCRGPGSH